MMMNFSWVQLTTDAEEAKGPLLPTGNALPGAEDAGDGGVGGVGDGDGDEDEDAATGAVEVIGGGGGEGSMAAGGDEPRGEGVGLGELGLGVALGAATAELSPIEGVRMPLIEGGLWGDTGVGDDGLLPGEGGEEGLVGGAGEGSGDAAADGHMVKLMQHAWHAQEICTDNS